VDHVQAIDPATNEVVSTVETTVAPDGLAFDGSTLWVATEIGLGLAGIDPSTQEVIATATVADHGLINSNQVMVFEDVSLAADHRRRRGAARHSAGYVTEPSATPHRLQ
jgi:DNA-binding beta-propeller fold protein YncE